jgi:hypothetical protein
MVRMTSVWTLAAAIAATTPLVAQVNGSFDASIAGWTLSKPEQASASHDGGDAGGICGSGSARVTIYSDLTPGSGEGIKQCLPATGGATYDARAWVRPDPGQARTGSTSLALFFYTDANCTQNAGIGSGDGDATPPDGSWRLLRVTNATAQPPRTRSRCSSAP